MRFVRWFITSATLSGLLGLLAFGHLTSGSVLAGQESEVEALPSQSHAATLVVQAGHSGPVRAVALAPDGRSAVSASWDNTLKIWDVTTGLELRTLAGHNREVTAVAISPSGKQILSAGWDMTVRLWDLNSGAQIGEYLGHKHRLTAVVFLPDGERFLTASRDGALKLWSVSSANELTTFSARGAAIEALAVSPDGRQALAAAGNEVRIWDIPAGKVVGILRGHGDAVNCVRYMGSHHAVTGSSDGTVQLWDLQAGRDERILRGHGDAVWSVDVSADGREIVSAGMDHTIKRWESASGTLISSVESGHGAVWAACYSADGTALLTGHFDGSLGYWDLSRQAPVRVFGGTALEAKDLVLSGDGRILVFAGWDRRLWKWALDAGSAGPASFATGAVVTALAFTPQQEILAAAEDGNIDLWVNGEPQAKTNFSAGDEPAQALAAAPGRIFYGSKGGRLGSLSLVEPFETRPLAGHGGAVTSISLSPDGHSVLTTSHDRTIKRWDSATGELRADFVGHKNWVSQACFSADGRSVITGSWDKTVGLWDAAGGGLVRQLNGHRGAVRTVACSPREPVALSAGDDRELRLWDIETGELLKILTGHSGTIRRVVFTPDGRRAFSTAEDKSIVVWDLEVGRWLAKLYVFSDGTWAVVDPEGRFDASNGGDVIGLHWVVGNEPIALSQLKERYYEPNLLGKVLGFNKERLRDVQTFDQVALFPAVEIIPPSESDTSARIVLRNRGGGIGKVRVLVNGKEIAADARGATADPDSKRLELSVEIPTSLLVTGEENILQVLAWNGAGYLASRGERITLKSPAAEKVEPPALHAIVVGVSRYANPQINLNFSGKDAVDMATALQIAGQRLFGVERVHVTLLSDVEKNAGALPPTRTNIEQAFAKACQARASDLLVVFLAGHGVMAGAGDQADYYFLTSAARSTDLSDPATRQQYGVSSTELTEWLKKIPSLKQVMILDTCAAGGAIAKLTESRSLSGSQVRSLERLKDRTGFHVLMGAAADRQSLEASQYGQGLLTYAILAGIKGAALRDGQFVDVQMLFQHVADEVPQLARNIGGIQRPLVAAPRGTSFDIGQLTVSDKAQVPLETVKPLLLRASFLSARPPKRDSLKLSSALNARMREETAAYGGSLVFVDADELPGAHSLTGDYRISGEKVEVEAYLASGENALGTFLVSGEVGDLDVLCRSILVETLALIRAHKTHDP